jgi:aerobic-type carbon monoxide dehydrogenase small subunit (CoxS/CutS family)
MPVTLTVDGACHDLDVNSGRTLADILGTECGVTGCRVACLDGTCGLCAVVVDGETIRSCLSSRPTPNTSAAASPVIVALRTG